MRSINNVCRHVSIDKNMDTGAKEQALIRTVGYLIGDHLEGLVDCAIEHGDTFEYELKINQIDDTETHRNYEIELDRAHIWSVFGSRPHG